MFGLELELYLDFDRIKSCICDKYRKSKNVPEKLVRSNSLSCTDVCTDTYLLTDFLYYMNILISTTMIFQRYNIYTINFHLCWPLGNQLRPQRVATTLRMPASNAHQNLIKCEPLEIVIILHWLCN